MLIFGPHSLRHLFLDDEYIHCELQFDRWESLQIPYECIARMFDKGNQFYMQWTTYSPEDDLRSPAARPRIAIAPKNPSPTQKKKKTKTALTSAKSKAKKSSSRIIEVNFRGD